MSGAANEANLVTELRTRDLREMFPDPSLARRVFTTAKGICRKTLLYQGALL